MLKPYKTVQTYVTAHKIIFMYYFQETLMQANKYLLHDRQ